MRVVVMGMEGKGYGLESMWMSFKVFCFKCEQLIGWWILIFKTGYRSEGERNWGFMF